MNHDLDDEIRAHLDLEIQQNIEAGMSPEEARYAALRAFGNVAHRGSEPRTRESLCVTSPHPKRRARVRMPAISLLSSLDGKNDPLRCPGSNAAWA